ncbi:hypothetical protein CEXT_538681 [Caerostris extrusa]|uniref:Uncharacterized protein n=1 Tax=Caerostris extrusa TaxID=172846 RepID=A0AAV4Y5W5_CAEEX|nr:hypothetical protein CEXT_538681 [Caerostris extrusa]
MSNKARAPSLLSGKSGQPPTPLPEPSRFWGLRIERKGCRELPLPPSLLSPEERRFGRKEGKKKKKNTMSSGRESSGRK